MNGIDFAYFHFRARRIREGKCICREGRCVICDLMWEGWPHPHCKHEHGSGLMDTNGNGEFTCHDCGHTLVLGRGLRNQQQGGAAAARQAHNLKVAGSNPAPALITLQPENAETWECSRCSSWTSTMLTRCYMCDTQRSALQPTGSLK